MEKFNRIPAVILTCDPLPSLADLCRELAASGLCPVFVIDAGSKEKCRDIFDGIRAIDGCTVISRPYSCGRGRILREMFDRLLCDDPEVCGCLEVDGDRQYSAEDIHACVSAFCGTCDSLILGAGNFSAPAVSAGSRFENFILSGMYRCFAQIPLRDSQTGLRVYPAALMRLCLHVNGDGADFENRALIAAREEGIPVGEVPVSAIPIRPACKKQERPCGRAGRGREHLRIFGIILSCFFRYTISSLSSSVIDILLYGLIYWLLADSMGVTAGTVIATVIGRIVSSAYNFAMNYLMVYRSRKKVAAALSRYILLVLVQMAASAALTAFCNHFLPINTMITKAAVDTLIFFINYTIQKRKIF